MNSIRRECWLTGFLMLGALLGCADSGGDGGNGQLQTSDAGRRLLGAWVANDGVDPQDTEVGVGMHRAIAENSFRLEFREGGAVTIRPGGDEVAEGTWQMVHDAGQRVVVRIAAPMYPDGAMQFQVQFDGDDRFLLVRDDGASAPLISFTRMRGRASL